VSGGDRRNANAVLLAELIAGHTITAAAKTAGISEATARRRMCDSAFKAKVEAGQDEIVRAAISTLAASTEAASLTLRSLLSTKVADSVRLSAAKSIIDLSESLRHGNQLDNRLAAIEAMLNQLEGDKPSLPIAFPNEGVQ
jgi:phage terminase small subunit